MFNQLLVSFINLEKTTVEGAAERLVEIAGVLSGSLPKMTKIIFFRKFYNFNSSSCLISNIDITISYMSMQTLL